MSALSRPVLHPPCEQCGESEAHADECEGEPRPETLSQALARAQASAERQLRQRALRYLEETGFNQRRGALAGGKFCSPCRGNPRYPDHRCAQHTTFLVEVDPVDRRLKDSDPVWWLATWRVFFETVDRILKS